MIRWLIDFRFAVHYGLNSDIELRRKSAKLGNDKSSIDHLAGCASGTVKLMPSSPETWRQIEIPKISGM
jgi:hypothetical protein